MSELSTINAKEVSIGINCYIGKRVEIAGLRGGPVGRFVLGDNCRIEDDCRLYVNDFETGDYFTLHNHGLVTGLEPIKIGHSVWIGQNTVLNGTDRLTIGNGVGIGAASQLWTHIRHGDTLQGCRWDSTKPLVIGDDVWFVGHCIVSPIIAHARSMAMVGAVITKDMEENHVYGGSPARDLTDRLGPQFGPVSDDEKFSRAEELLARFHHVHPEFSRGSIRLVRRVEEFGSSEATYVAVLDRLYKKYLSEAEISFIRFAYPAKFFPK